MTDGETTAPGDTPDALRDQVLRDQVLRDQVSGEQVPGHMASAEATLRWKKYRVKLAPLSLIIGAVVVVLDQVTKHWAVNALADGREQHVIWTLQWNLAYNTGMAFSRGRNMGPVIGVLALVVVVILVAGASHLDGRMAKIAAGLLIGGALGNVSDRLFRGDGWMRGAVIDFIDFQWFPIFNVADMGVTCGAGLFILSTLLAGRRVVAPGAVAR